MINAHRRTTGFIVCFAALLVLGAYTAFEPTESSAAPEPSTTTTSTPAPTTTLRDRADGLPFFLPDPSVFPTSVAIPVTAEVGAKFQVTVACPLIADEPLSVLNANLDAVATPDINPNPIDLLWPPGIDLQLIADSATPDDNGVFTFSPVAPSETGTYYIRAACTFSES